VSLRVAVIGAGSIGMRHVRNLLGLGCDVFVADMSTERESAALALGAKELWSRERIDAAVIATPHDKHLGWAKAFFNDRTPLFIEKPLGAVSELAEWRRLALAYASAAIPGMTGYQCRFHPVAEAMRQLMTPPDSGFFATACDMRTWPGQSYGPLLLEASHDLDIALMLGAPTTVTEAVIDPHYVGISLGPHWRVTIEDRADYRREWTVEKDGQSMSLSALTPTALGDQMYYDEMAHFIACVREGRQTDCPLSDGVRVLEVAAQVEQMARQAA
jgi:predicted dehydrogenase